MNLKDLETKLLFFFFKNLDMKTSIKFDKQIKNY